VGVLGVPPQLRVGSLAPVAFPCRAGPLGLAISALGALEPLERVRQGRLGFVALGDQLPLAGEHAALELGLPLAAGVAALLGETARRRFAGPQARIADLGALRRGLRLLEPALHRFE